MEVKEQGEKVTRTVCMIFDGIACGMLAHVKDGVLTKVEPADFPEPGYRFACLKGLCTPKIVYHPDRLKYPMKRVGERGEGKWHRISWDEALDIIAGKLKDIREKYNPESVAYLLNGGISIPSGPMFSGQRWASASGGTYVGLYGDGDANLPCANMASFGMLIMENYLMDFENPGLRVSWGMNFVETAGYRCRRFREAREKGTKMVAIDPRFTPTAAKADEWIPIRLGTDAALALGMINVILNEGLCDEPFITEYTNGPFLVRNDNGRFLRERDIPSGDSTSRYIIWDTKTNKPQISTTPDVIPALRGSYTIDGIECKPAFQLLIELVMQYPLERVSEITEVSPDVIKRLALDHATRKPVVTDKGMGSQRTFHGDLSHRAINTLAAVTGNISLKPGVDMFAALNFAPFMFPEMMVAKQFPIVQFIETVLTEDPYPIKAMWISHHNPANQEPDRNKFKECMSRMEFTVVVDLFMTPTAEYADVVLPACTTFECTNVALPWMIYVGGHPYIQMQPKVIEPYYESKTDLEIFNELAPRMGLGEFFDKSNEEYLEMLFSSGHASLEGITLEKIKEGPMKAIPYAKRLFMTPSGRIEFYVEKLKEFGQELPVYMEPMESIRQPLAQKYPLSFLQTHIKYRQHSMFANVDWIRELEPEPVLDMNPVDSEKRNIRDGDMVTAFNDRGSVTLKARIHEGIKPGVVNVNQGWWPRDFVDGSHQELTHGPINPVQQILFEPNASYYDVLCEVKKAKEE